MWTPDVYEGVPTPVTTFFASAPKIATMAVLVRILLTAFPGIAMEWRQIVTFVSIASMALGAFAAIGQTNIKRLMAYSSIGHMGFALVGVAAGSVEGAQSVVLYMAIYLVMTLGTFAGILSMRRNGEYVETIEDLAGLSRTNPSMAFFLAAMMFSLAGVPPLAGFFAKFYVFAAAINAGLYGLAVIGVLASAVGAYYYLRIVKLMYFDEAARPFDAPTTAPRYVLGVAAAVLILGVFVPRRSRQRRDGGGQIAVLRRCWLKARARRRVATRSRAGASSASPFSTRPARRPSAGRSPAIPAACGSSPTVRQPAAAGTAATGARRPAISTVARSWSRPARWLTPRSSDSSRDWPRARR